MSSKRHDVRRIFFVDPDVQGALIKRVVIYWLACVITVSLFILCSWVLIGRAGIFITHFDEMWFYYSPALVASLLLLPLLVTDIIRFSNRFVGPLVRLRRGLRAVGRGESTCPIRFRDGDFWKEFALEYNAVLRRVEALEARLSSVEDDSQGGVETDDGPEVDKPVGTRSE